MLIRTQEGQEEGKKCDGVSHLFPLKNVTGVEEDEKRDERYKRVMNMFPAFLQSFCCFIPCPIGLLLLAIPPVVLTLRRRKAVNTAKQTFDEMGTTSIQEA